MCSLLLRDPVFQQKIVYSIGTRNILFISRKSKSKLHVSLPANPKPRVRSKASKTKLMAQHAQEGPDLFGSNKILVTEVGGPEHLQNDPHIHYNFIQ